MKTIEEFAQDYVDSPDAGAHPYNRLAIVDAYIAGAKNQRENLTRWNNPFVKDMPKDNVLVKYIVVGCPNKPYYTIGRREPSGWWDCENELAPSQPRFEIIGWRPIYE